MSRPELTGHAAHFYNAREARKYDSSSRMVGVQREITERAVELLNLGVSGDNNGNTGGGPKLILDIGCGSGLSGQVLEELGHVWVGCDVSRDMLHVAKERMMENRQQGQQDDAKRKQGNRRHRQEGKKDNSSSMMQDKNDDDEDDDDEEEEESDDDHDVHESTGDLLEHDMGTGLPFRPATFDACISISALQWLCYSNTKMQNPKKRLTRFFSSLYTVLKRGGRAVLQFYPETAEQAVLISETACSCGFTGGVVVDYPNSAKAKKHYLVLSFDRSAAQKKGAAVAAVAAAAASAAAAPQQQIQQHQVAVSQNRKKDNKPTVVRKKKGVKTKEWILHKKDTERKRGKNVRPDTKYTARRRPHKF